MESGHHLQHHVHTLELFLEAFSALAMWPGYHWMGGVVITEQLELGKGKVNYGW